MPMVSITGEQQKVMDEALRLRVIGAEKEALETGFAAVRDRVKQKNLDLAATEQAELDRIAANQFSLFGDEPSGSLEAGPALHNHGTGYSLPLVSSIVARHIIIAGYR